ncbi:M20 metallopeptidase family protein [Tuberibacillus sp. Marseille-P3662]|uniref:M20 metallopeptidase family protein n=1 Tax=Tuberibacillus sp. Marseille-P3662 TaxID=1965358 RepID=UPI000A1C912D|nr:M20 family metallopeptidase [Tuberibacillus sp. Marseille-P3662]
MEVKEMAKSLESHVIEIRRRMHQHPELSSFEYQTSKLVKETLENRGFEISSEVGGTGVVALLRGKHPGKTIGLRADMDALPISEQTDLAFSSETADVMHACGHDFHTSILLGTALILSECRDQLRDNVKFIFQPAEENMSGAQSMIAAGVLQNPRVDALVCLHCWPPLPAGTIGVRKGPIMAASDFFNINIKGTGGHAAHPHKSTDPVPIAGHVVTALQHIVSREVAPLDPAVVTVGQINGGSARNVIAQDVEMSGTVRTTDPGTRREIPDIMKRIVSKTAESMNGEADIQYHKGSPSLVNDDDLVDLLEDTVTSALGKEYFHELKEPSLGGEDFAFYLDHVPGMLFRLGTNNGTEASKLPLHNPGVIFDEAALVPGMTAMSELALRYLKG